MNLLVTALTHILIVALSRVEQNNFFFWYFVVAS